MPSALEALHPSKLDPQNQLLSEDLDVETLRFFIRGKEQAVVDQMVTDGSIERTMLGASTLKFDLMDADRVIQQSGLLTKETDVNLDGLYFRLAQIDRQGDILTTTFEDREVALLRQHDGFRKAVRGQMTRAEFAHSLVREENRVHIRFYSPEEHFTQKIAPDPTTPGDSLTGQGFAPGAPVTVKGVNATPVQRRNIETVLNVGQNMGMPDLILLAAIETITVESSALNLSGGDLDSVGIFQQRNIAPWNKRNRRNVEQAATTFYEVAKADAELVQHRGGHLTDPGLAQMVQQSAFPERYAQYQQEAQTTLNLFRGGQTAQIRGNNSFLSQANGGGVYEFSRGTIDPQGRLTKENTWDCLNRLATEVDWRCFMVNGTVYFISDHYLFQSRPRMTIDADEIGIDQIDFTLDAQKTQSQLTITCHVRRWGAPPGSMIVLQDHGAIDGRWLVQDITRSLFNNTATITCVKPLPELPEPPATGTGTPDSTLVGPTSSQRQAIVQAAQKVLANAREYTYRQYRPMAESIFDQFAKTHTDCSAFVTLCYKAGGAPDPNGFNYNGAGFTGTLWSRGSAVQESDAQPGDLVFYGRSLGGGRTVTRHVALYIGGGQTIEFGSTHPNKGTVHEASDFVGIRSYI